MVTTADVRTTLNVNDTNVLPDALITLMIADAGSITGQSDEIAVRYYTCYLIADNWDSIAGTEVIEGVKFRKPNPEGFLNAYNRRVTKLQSDQSSDFVGFAKVSTNKDFVYDATDLQFRERKGSDPKY